MLTLEQVKSKSAGKLGNLHPAVLAGTTELIRRCYNRGVPILITQGMRTIAQQNELYAQGRTKKGDIVTNARGGSSYHNYGLAIDFALLLPDGKSVSWDINRDGDGDKVADWQEVAQEGKKLGFEWGGDWTSFKDYAHLQMSFGLTTSQLKAGKRPAAQQVTAALSRINGGEPEVNKDIPINITLNGRKLTNGLMDNATTYAPVRAIAEALGAQVTYDARTKTVNIVKE
ncbi:M15 family metallopeptidase [Paenibacillus tritici]|uniref:M15 family metallopeptidase n=1 Tax=Paenibacillus tritici TaxID=1873425 RepID=A0ABX2DIM7_9BACL|nr:M15 family metallopeptidase [Paenibacillus tritici]NQX44437.1 M15 family metallopeptidase [Paenibacillus tritici]